MTITFAQSRVNQELAKEGVIPFPRCWASSWPCGSPSAGLLLHFVPSFIIIIAIPFGDAYNFILDLEGYPSSVINFFVVLGLVILRRKAPEAPRPFKVWLPVAGIFMVGQVFLLVAPFIKPPGGKGDTSLPYWLYPIVSVAVLTAGILYWFGWRVLVPYLGRFEYRERKCTLQDGTIVTEYLRMKKT